VWGDASFIGIKLVVSKCFFYRVKFSVGFGRAPAGRAIRCKSSFVPHSGLSATIPHAPANAALSFVPILLLSPLKLIIIGSFFSTLSFTNNLNRHGIF